MVIMVPILESISGDALKAHGFDSFMQAMPSMQPHAIADAGGLKPLIALLDSTSTSRSQEYAAAALAQLGTVRVGQLAISLGGGIAPLVAMAETGSVEAAMRAAWALANLAVDSAANKTAIREGRGLAALVNLLRRQRAASPLATG